MDEGRKKKGRRGSGGITRRGFISSVGVGVVAATTAGRLEAEAEATPVAAGEMVEVTLVVNGHHHRLLVEPRWSLLFVLRERLGLTGAKASCERGECGACTVLLDGLPRYACMTLAVEAELSEITTVEGLLQGEELADVQQAFAQEDAFQCGYCTPGQVIAAEALLRTNAQPTEEQIRNGMSGNLCRCGAYAHITRAVARAAQAREAKGGAR
jgi:xanthine dehydrogenase YagT iron-sulfur-binding subunit